MVQRAAPACARARSAGRRRGSEAPIDASAAGGRRARAARASRSRSGRAAACTSGRARAPAPRCGGAPVRRTRSPTSAVEHPVAAQCVDHRSLDSAALEVDLQPDRPADAPRRTRAPRRGSAGRARPAAARRASGYAPGRGRPLTDLVQVVRVRKHERPVREVQHVELEHVAAELRTASSSAAQRVLRSERRCAAVADAGELARGPTQLDQTRRSSPRRRRSRRRARRARTRGSRRAPPRASSRRRELTPLARATAVETCSSSVQLADRAAPRSRRRCRARRRRPARAVHAPRRSSVRARCRARALAHRASDTLPSARDDPRRRMPCAGRRDAARAPVDDEVDHRDELARRDLADDDFVRRLEEVARLGMLARQRAEDELRHRHVRSGFDAVPCHVAERDRKPAVRRAP